MSFTVILYKNASPVNKIGKTLNNAETITGVQIKRDTSILQPVLLIESTSSIFTYNYMYIEQFGRYYFIDDIRSINNNIWEISAHVDVLDTYATAIKANSAVVKRQRNKFNLYLDDPEFHVLNKQRVQTFRFPENGFDKTLKYILVVSGS